ncbi:hypothetical protein [Conexibacter arvalis]|uniref:ATP-grasp domain-containing protein n=1 Tax=Conexibacter arvalis TaxID=912552 RepID=A0A840IHJ4_9ACTN|nr:hypothetical protein [Conexibacter arvalis]MBB4664246.1 hypothetical protein [Conexibacter arvalis]
MPDRPSLLLVTDHAYQARGRRYCDEDIFLAARLRERFRLATCDPRDALGLLDRFDAVLVRNSGPVLGYAREHAAFAAAALARGARVYNQLAGRGDMAGKQYLLDLTAAGFPVIPTVDRRERLDRLPDVDQYVVKPKLGADSIGLEVVGRERLDALAFGDVLVQPRVDFRYEVSFYFVDDVFQYALYAPDPERRWALERYEPSDADLRFARRFVDWNGLEHGIQRVDACRAPDGELLLVELEDLNPYLSLDLLDAAARDRFVDALTEALERLLACGDACCGRRER